MTHFVRPAYLPQVADIELQMQGSKRLQRLNGASQRLLLHALQLVPKKLSISGSLTTGKQ